MMLQLPRGARRQRKMAYERSEIRCRAASEFLSDPISLVAAEIQFGRHQQASMAAGPAILIQIVCHCSNWKNNTL
jgi:hypothetical protein